MARPSLSIVSGSPPAPPSAPPVDDHETVILPPAARASFEQMLGRVGAIRPAMQGMSTTTKKRREARAQLLDIAKDALAAAEALS